MELVQSDGNFYLNAETFNTTSSPIDAVITISDRDDILKFQEHWMVHVRCEKKSSFHFPSKVHGENANLVSFHTSTRFAIDTQASLYYVKPDNDVWVTLTTVQYGNLAEHRVDNTKHFVDQRTLRMTNGASTLADFLEQLNAAVPVITSHEFSDQPTIAGGSAWQSGLWSVTPSGAFKFQAKMHIEGKVAEPRGYDENRKEYMVNIRMSESMRKILGFKYANSRVLGNQSSLRQWKETLAKFMDELPAYRKNIDNWRWVGTRMNWRRCHWYSEMWYIINSIILRGVPINHAGHVDMANHPTTGDYARDQAFITGVDFWQRNDFLITNYVTPWGAGGVLAVGGGNADSSHEYTQFSEITAKVSAVLADGSRRTTLQMHGLDGAVHNQVDNRWSTQVDQDGSGFTVGNQDQWVTHVATHSGRHAFVHNAKQTWGSWTRAYILKVLNTRQIHINREALDPVIGANAVNVGDGGIGFGIAPVVGDTIYIPGSRFYDGTGAEANYTNDYDRMQRGIITAVELSTAERVTGAGAPPNYAAEPTWLLTFDTALEENGFRYTNLNCRQAAGGAQVTGANSGDPQARVIYGTRRLPCQPMVYFGIVSATVAQVGSGITFESSKEFPVSIGDSVYIGHTPNDSKQAHLVTLVDYITKRVTIEALDVTQITEHTIVIGMARDEVYNATVVADKLALELTAVSIAIRGGADLNTRVDASVCRNRMVALEEKLQNSISARHFRVTADSAYGLRDLTLEEANAPEIIRYDSHGGYLTIGADVVRAGGDGTENNIIASDLMRFIGASARFLRVSGQTDHHNNRNSSPSNYFQVDLPEATGIYAEPVFNDFMEGHYREDWYVFFDLMTAYDGVNNNGDLTPNLADNNNNVAAVIQFNSHLVMDPSDVDNGRSYFYKLCGLATTDAYLVGGGDTTHKNRKMICYTFDRTAYPGHYATVNGNFDNDTQFFTAVRHDAATNVSTNPIFGKLRVKSGFGSTDGVQAIFKGNSSLDITDNNAGINLAVRTTDYMKSEKSGQVDVAFPYKSISITSNDLMAIPERSGDANILQPILSSYSIPTMFDAGASIAGKIESFTSTPYGTITFSEGGARRYHSLTSIPGGLRQFTVRCILDPKDDTAAKTPVKLPAGGRFSVQFVFVRKG